MQTFVVLARTGTAEVVALIGAAFFLSLIGFFLFWGGPPSGR